MLLHALAFTLGAWLLQQQAMLPSWWGALGLLPLSLAVGGLWRRAPAAGRGALAVLLLGAGFYWAAGLAALRLAEGLAVEWEGRDITLTGVVAEPPQQHPRGMRFRFDVETAEPAAARVPEHVSLGWYGRGLDPQQLAALPRAGERWRFTARLRRPHGSVNPHGFDLEAWLLEENLRATGTVRGNAVKLAERVERPRYWIAAARQGVRERFARVLQDQPYQGVLAALAVGDQQSIPADQWRVFTRTGVNHLMSISGLHVTLVGSLGFLVVGALWRRIPRLALWLPTPKAAVAAGLAVAFGYALLAGFGVPAQRTVYMLGAAALAVWNNRAGSFSGVLGSALFAVVLLDPWAVLAAGFWLSFGAVAAMVFVLQGRLQADRWLLSFGRVQWAVTVALTPLLLALFQQTSLVSPLANAFAIPLVSWVVTPLALAGAVLPWDGPLALAHHAMAAGMALLEPLSRLPDAVWQQHAPPGWTVPVAVAGSIWLLLPRGFPARWVGGVGFLPLFFVLPPAPLPGTLHVAVLDVGQGLAVVVRTARHALLYDAGPDYSSSDAGARIVAPYLRGAGIRRLDGMVLSHDDRDHNGGAASVLQAVPVDWLLASFAAEHPLWAGAPAVGHCHESQSWEWDGVRFEMLHPPRESYRQLQRTDNARSCVLRIATAHGSLLLTGDIEHRSERELLEQAAWQLPAEVLVAPHHGGKSASGADFVAAVRPRQVIFSAGYRNPFGHPRPEVAQRYRAIGSEIRRTDRDGALLLRFADGRIGTQTARQSHRRYWQDRPDLGER